MLAEKIIMLRPSNFGYNPETAITNAFQERPDGTKQQIKSQALTEFDGLVGTLQEAGIHIDIWEEDASDINTYDAVFLNNWFSTHPDNTIFTYPMFSPSRRLERNSKYLENLTNTYQVLTKISLENYEQLGIFLESTGSMVIDHANGIVYGNRSPRTNEILFFKWARLMGFTPILFDALDRNRISIYHTNVLMGLGERFVVINSEAIPYRDWEILKYHFNKTGKEIIEIDHSQMESFAGNVLPLVNKNGKRILAMSTSAFESLTRDQICRIEAHALIVKHDISTIESVGGGSVRCMIAENYL
ncbi:citrulline utilization hydrolase CtlX [Membranihabitans maritimus]|uniref:citrulline utilization hydrolase CtlX n=1 Tax=Membranihabitans maritimus TaxID=2904244 RepID=UPI001F260308|nr:arginine deiminase-related protein [Membranihabitans maritimus]